MKQKLAWGLLFVILSTGAFAQGGNNPATKKSRLFGFHVNVLDFQTAESWKSTSTPRVATKFRDMDWGLGLSYWNGLTPYIDWSLRLNANLHDYALDRGEETSKFEAGLELEPSVHLRPIKDNNRWAPMLSLGIGAGYYTGEFAAYVPAGVGVQFNFNSSTYILLQGLYKWSLSESDLKDHLVYSLGFMQRIGSDVPKVVPPPPPPPVTDRDGDGVLDEDDRCPDVAGLAALKGCPDRDGDGIADMDDKCPDVKGTAKYNGCPIPDTDGDGINDEEDKCPTVKGVARYQGCPIPDTDNDGINDEEDKCPTRPGPASNQGCPEIAKEIIEKVKFAARNVFYATGSYQLLPKSHAALKDVAALLKSDPSLMIDIDGHTDSQGSDESNQILSENRAKSVRDYLISQGVDGNRLKATGYGETQPVADNSTAAGRAKNRRTEMTVRNY